MTCDCCNTDDDISRFDRNYSIVLFYTSEQNRTEELFYTSVDRTDQSIESLRLANLPAINLTTNNTSLADGFSTIDSLILNKRGRWFIESSVIEGASLAYFTEDLPWDRVRGKEDFLSPYPLVTTEESQRFDCPASTMGSEPSIVDQWTWRSRNFVGAGNN